MVTSVVVGGLWEGEGVQGLCVVGKAVVVIGLAATVTARDVDRVTVVAGAGGSSFLPAYLALCASSSVSFVVSFIINQQAKINVR